MKSIGPLFLLLLMGLHALADTPEVKPTPERLPGAFVHDACFEFAEAYCYFNHGCLMVVVTHSDKTTGHVLVLTPDHGLVDNFHPYPLHLAAPGLSPTDQLELFYTICGYEWGDSTFEGSIDYDHLTKDTQAALDAMRKHQAPHPEHKALHY